MLLCCYKVWLANCNEQQIRRLYLRIAPLPTGPTWRLQRPALDLSVNSNAVRNRSKATTCVNSSLPLGRLGAASNAGTSTTRDISEDRARSTPLPSTVCQRPAVGPPFHVHTARVLDLKTEVSSGTSPPTRKQLSIRASNLDELVDCFRREACRCLMCSAWRSGNHTTTTPGFLAGHCE
jgi:hypothetical protein